MNKFIKEHGQMVLWFIFVIFMFISLSMVFTHGPEYAIIVFIFSFILLCPPVIKLIQRKTRIKKVVLGAIAALILSFTMMMSNHFSGAKKEEQIRTFQEKKEEREKKTEEQTDEKRDTSEESKSQNQMQTSAPQQSLEKEMKATMDDIKKEQKAQEQKQEKTKKVVVRASKKSGQYYTPEHPSYNKVAAKNLLVFNSEEAAQKAGYKRAA
ncbi:O-antigen ligase family protein [Gemella morbillorum]|uniref:sunset domain-containing protein n=1 Tax=Gemella morbillorum TaxID=29391 RepID=UPI0023F51D57|nr:O-antigen ligase family protein [Gemella morbillorum]